MQKVPLTLLTTARLIKSLPLSLVVALITIAPIAKTNADTLTVAVASNFAETLEALAADFEQTQPHNLVLVRGSSGRHFAQIINGAPFDIFFSADSTRVQALVNEGIVSAEYTHTYATGQLALWSTTINDSAEIRSLLHSARFERLAIANPRLAPYGQAAVEVLENLGLIAAIDNRKIVTGENVAQAFQFVATGNADLGFVAVSQLTTEPETDYWRIPPELHKPIAQQLAVLVESPASRSFLNYLTSPKAQAIILQHGYLLTGNN